MRVDKVYTRFYDELQKTWVIIVKVGQGNHYRYETVYRETEAEAMKIKEGDVL